MDSAAILTAKTDCRLPAMRMHARHRLVPSVAPTAEDREALGTIRAIMDLLQARSHLRIAALGRGLGPLP